MGQPGLIPWSLRLRWFVFVPDALDRDVANSVTCSLKRCPYQELWTQVRFVFFSPLNVYSNFHRSFPLEIKIPLYPRSLKNAMRRLPQGATIMFLTYPILSYTLGRWLGMAVSIYWAGPPAWNLTQFFIFFAWTLEIFRAGPP